MLIKAILSESANKFIKMKRPELTRGNYDNTSHTQASKRAFLETTSLALLLSSKSKTYSRPFDVYDESIYIL